jgi:hypothetical protein
VGEPGSKQFSLSAILVLVTAVSCLFAIANYLGWESVLLAIVPPLLIAGFLRGLRAEFFHPGLKEYPHVGMTPLTTLVSGFAIWLPCFCVLMYLIHA